MFQMRNISGIRSTSMSGWADFLEIDKAALDVERYQLHAKPVADIQALEAMNQLPFNRNVEKPGPGAFIRSTRDNRIKLFADSRFKEERRCRFADLPFALVSGILFFGAVFRQRRGCRYQGRTAGRQI